MVKLGIFADTHIGRSIPRVIGELRRKAFRYAFTQAVDLFLREKVDYVIHAGDLFERRSMTPEDTMFVKNMLQRLVDGLGDIKIYALRGNHDGTLENSTLNYVEHPLAKYFKVVGEEALKGNPEVYMEPSFTLTGLGYTPYINHRFSEVKEKLKAVLARGETNHKIILLHAFIDGFHKLPPGIPSHQKLPLSMLMDVGATLVICGHHHKREELKLENGAIVLTPGGVEHIDLADEGPHGCYIAELNSTVKLRFEALKPLHKIKNIKIDSGGSVKPESWYVEEVKRSIEGFLGELKGEEGILRIVLQGILDGSRHSLQEELRKVAGKAVKSPLLHVEVENMVEPLRSPIQITQTTRRSEFLEETFKSLGDLPRVLELIDEVDTLLEEKASEKTGLLKDGDRAEFVDKWLKILGVKND